MQYKKIFKELDIVLWKLRYPIVLGEDMSVQLWVHLRLLLISDSSISLYNPLINDVLRVMCIDLKEVCILTMNQIDSLILPIGFSCHCWWIGLAKLRDFRGVCLYTSSLSALQCNVRVKRDLWSQISQIMHLLHT